MAKAPKKRTAKEGEVVAGEDAFGIDILDVPEYRSGNARDWIKCDECGNEILIETNGKTYFHKLSCSLSNGIGYNDERKNTTLPHHPQCDCMTCQPPKGAK
jgi:hypothetical protein